MNPRTEQVAGMIASGLNTKEIAADLHLSPKTVEWYRAKIFQELHTHSVAIVTQWALAKGLLTCKFKEQL